MELKNKDALVALIPIVSVILPLYDISSNDSIDFLTKMIVALVSIPSAIFMSWLLYR